MEEGVTEIPELTIEQRAVVDRPAEDRVLVTAGAGAGKTHTLVRRLDRLVAEEDLGTGQILVLTFSRAAVRELSDRLAQYGDNARFIRARTFDSWALDVLRQTDALGGWEERSFTARIDGARRAVEDGLADEMHAELLHVVVDEVQDLVGGRRELVEAFLERVDCGFTMVGDPAQAIYGFTLGANASSADRRAETNRFFVWLRNTYGEELTELSLTHNFRASTEEARTALAFGPRLRETAESGTADDRVYVDLRSALGRMLDLGALDDGYMTGAIGGWDGTTAILCRTNGEALQVSEALNAGGVAHQLRRSARDRAVPIWLGLLLRAADVTMLSRVRFDGLVGALPMPAGLTPDRAWKLLARTGTGRGNDKSIDLGRVRTALATGRLPDELTAQPAARVVVSSFHRAKGLEFDQVVVVDPGPPRVTDGTRANGRRSFEADAKEDARALYVAMTRPRRDLYRLNALDSPSIRHDDRIGRWGRYGWQYWVRGGVEVVSGDVLTDRPAGTKGFEADPTALQDHLATSVRPGDPVVLERLTTQPIGLDESPDYLIVHGNRLIGVTSERFRTQLYRHMKTSRGFEPRNWPREITGVRVDAVETVVGSEAAGIEAGLGPRGVWLAPRLYGLSRFAYDQKEKDVTVR